LVEDLDTWAYGAKRADGTRKNGGITNGDADWGIFPKSVTHTGKDYDDRNKWRDEHKWYSELKKELKTLRETLWKRNQEFANAVVPDEKESEFARQGSFFSYFLGAIENECLHIAQEHMVENGMMKRNTCSLAYDGFTGKLNKGFVPSVVAEECSNLIQERTGFPMKMIDKPIEEKIQVDTLVRCEKMGDALIKPLVEDATWVSEVAPPKRRPLSAGAGDSDDDFDDLPVITTTRKTAKEATNISEWLDGFKSYKDPVYNDPNYLRWRREFEYGDRFDEKHMLIRQFSNYIYFSHEDDGNIKLMEKTKAELRTNYEHLKIRVQTGLDKKGKPKMEEKKCIELWFEDPDKRSYTRMTALPHGPRKCKDDTYNSYIPSKFFGKTIKPDDERWDARAVKYFKRHIKLVCNREEEPADFLMKWVASLIQNPQQKGAHIVISGQTGTGKNSLTELLKKIIGGNTLETTDPKRDVWGPFNLMMAGANLVILNEISQADAYQAEGKIKGLITDKKLSINGKGSNQFVMDSFHRFITLSNKDEPMKTSKQDRRNMITEMSPELREDEKFWRYWYDEEEGMMSENALLSVYSFLWNMELGDFNPLPPPSKMPLTQHHRELISYKPPLECFFLHFVTRMLHEREHILEDTTICDYFRDPEVATAKVMGEQERKGFVCLSGKDLWDEFLIWKTEGNGNKCEVSNATQLAKKIKNEIIRDMGLDKDKVCPTQRRTNSDKQDTYWNIYALRDYYIKEGDFIPDGNTIVLGALHPSLHQHTNSFVASFNPPVAGDGLNDMGGLDEALPIDYEGEGGSDDDTLDGEDSDEEPIHTSPTRMENIRLEVTQTPAPATPPSTVTTGESSKSTTPSSEERNKARERAELATEQFGNPTTPVVQRTFGRPSPNPVSAPSFGGMIWNALTGQMEQQK
jgi:hypothetical protein